MFSRFFLKSIQPSPIEIKSREYEAFTKTLLEKNFIKLKNKLEEEDKTKVLIVGQPGAGKSSLLKYVTNNQCTPKPTIGQKTDATHWDNRIISDFFHLCTDKIFIDSPGYDTSNHPIHSYLKYFPFSSFDKVLFVLHGKIHDSDIKILRKIRDEVELQSIVIVHNFSEKNTSVMRKEIKRDILNTFATNIPLIFCSSRTEEGIDKLKIFIKKL